MKRLRKAWNGGSIEAALKAAREFTERAIKAGCIRCDNCGGQGGSEANGVCVQCGGAGFLVPAEGMPFMEHTQ